MPRKVKERKISNPLPGDPIHRISRRLDKMAKRLGVAA